MSFRDVVKPKKKDKVEEHGIMAFEYEGNELLIPFLYVQVLD